MSVYPGSDKLPYDQLLITFMCRVLIQVDNVQLTSIFFVLVVIESDLPAVGGCLEPPRLGPSEDPGCRERWDADGKKYESRAVNVVKL